MPLHSRWRHFEFQGIDRWALASRWRCRGGDDRRASAAAALISPSSAFCSMPAPGRSGGITMHAAGRPLAGPKASRLQASTMFRTACFRRIRAIPCAPMPTPAESAADKFGLGLQITDANPMVGIDGRIALLRRLGRTVQRKSGYFRRGTIHRAQAGFSTSSPMRRRAGTIPATSILTKLLTHLGPIWPSRLTLGGVALGDCWRHPLVTTSDATNGLVPLHKLSQWLAYSLIEPLQWAGIDGDGYRWSYRPCRVSQWRAFHRHRRAGLRDPMQAMREHDVVIDPGRGMARRSRSRCSICSPQTSARQLGCERESFPLAKVLQGGTWAAGRKLAEKLRPDGAPPIRVVSDGSVF